MTQTDDGIVEALQARLDALDGDGGRAPELAEIALQLRLQAEQVRARRAEAEAELQSVFGARDSGIADVAGALARARAEQARQEKLLALDASIRSRAGTTSTPGRPAETYVP